MTKIELRKIMIDNNIFMPEVDDAIQFVQDLLEFQAKELEETEPYAINTISCLRESARRVGDLQEYVEEAQEEK